MLTRISDVSYYVDRGLLFDDVNLTISNGDRMAIVGRNGCGKSTLLKVLGGDLPPASGKLEVTKDKRVLLVKQEMPDDDTKTPLEYLRDNDEQIESLYDRSEKASGSAGVDVANLAAELEVSRYEVAAPRILSGLGITPEMQNKPMTNLSGGMRMRINLAMALIQEPDLLLLDEPTNHLDLASVNWLMRFLKDYRKPFVMVSHDRTLLNGCEINKVLHLQYGVLTQYSGNFDIFKEEYEMRKVAAQLTNDNMDKKHAAQQKFIDKFKSNPKWARICQTREQWIRKDNAVRPNLVKEEPLIPIEFPACAELDGAIVQMNNACVGYELDKPVLSQINLHILSNARIGILGVNGQGKSTLAKLLTDNLEVCGGELNKNPRLSIGYFSQDQNDVLNQDLTVYAQYASVLNNPTEEMVRSGLAHYGFDRGKIETRVSDLSGGEKTRLLMAVIAARAPQLIIMDEPTNHLDFETREALIEAIEKYNGAVVLISHDWDLLEKVTKQHWLVSDGRVHEFKKGLEAYRKLCENPAAALVAKKPAEPKKQASVAKSKSAFMAAPPKPAGSKNGGQNSHNDKANRKKK